VARPDFSEYVAHFTKEGPPTAAGRNDAPAVVAEIAPLSARERLIQILEERVIHATPMPYTGKPAVAFTECVWASLLEHSQTYSPYGIGFTKDYLFQQGGGPVFYMRQDLYRAQVQQQHGFHDTVWPFITPFVPEYASDEHVEEYWERPRVDYTPEREWRVPGDLTFEYGDVAFIVVENNRDGDAVAAIPPGNAFQGKILLTDNYSRITRLWPMY
jgi:hypothetical protein